MKKIFSNILIPLTLLSGIFGACQEYEINSQPDAPLAIYVDAQDSYTVLATSPSRVVFNVSSNTPWMIESDQQWCIPTPAMSASSSLVSEVVVNTEDNTGKQSRTATLKIKAEGIDEVKTITIVQASKESLVVVPFDERVDSYGETISFTISSNKAWEIIPSTAFVSNIDKTSGAGSEDGAVETISITVPANPGAVRTGQITVKTDYESYTFSITQNGVVLEIEDAPESTVISVGGSGLATEYITKIRSNKEWKVKVPEEYQSWLSAEKDGDNLKVTVTQSNRISTRKGQLILTTVELIDGFEGVAFEVEQPSPYSINATHEVDEQTGNVRISLKNGELVASNFKFKKGRVVIELDAVSAIPAAKFGFNFTSPSNGGNYKLHYESGTYWYRCAGGFAWVAPIKLTDADFMPLSEFRTVEFNCVDDPNAEGKLAISIHVNGQHYGTQSGRTDIFAAGDAGTRFTLECTGTPGADDYCIVKTITYYPAE